MWYEAVEQEAARRSQEAIVVVDVGSSRLLEPPVSRVVEECPGGVR